MATLTPKDAVDGESLRAGVIYCAPPDHHVIVTADERLRVVRGPRENRHRPAIDTLFRSAALAYAERAVGVILTGTLDDGTAGMVAIKQQGGIAVVQDPDSALYSAMPVSVMEHADVDFCLPLDQIARQLTLIVRTPPKPRLLDAPKHQLAMEVGIAEVDEAAHQQDDRPGRPSAYSCPDCGGVLWEINDGSLVRYRCRVGHAFSPESMLNAQDQQLEEALWSAVKTLEENARLSHRLMIAERGRGHEWLAERFAEKESDARQRAALIRRFLLGEGTEADVEPPAEPRQRKTRR